MISSSVLLWGGIALLALAAIRRRRARDAERLARWGVEEGEVANPFGELPEGELEAKPGSTTAAVRHRARRLAAAQARSEALASSLSRRLWRRQ